MVAVSSRPQSQAEVNKPKTNLSGLDEIAQYARRSKATVLGLIKTADFPAAKIGHCWESDTDLIDKWKREFIEKSIRAEQAAKAPKPPKRKRLSISTKQERW